MRTVKESKEIEERAKYLASLVRFLQTQDNTPRVTRDEGDELRRVLFKANERLLDVLL